ncbi:MAG TPA: hypothetical protein VFA60_12480 [Terriglobales bacterium]|nr:hypothetical protein [Terriglobales bacterium]
MLQLSEDDVIRALTPARALVALRAAFARGPASFEMPTRTQAPLAGGGVLLIMPCFDPAVPAAGVKLVSVSDAVRATYLWLDPKTGEVLATIAANYLTDVRTAAASALATDLLARPDAETLGIFGTGRQARAHLDALPLVRRFHRVLVSGGSPEKSEAFVRTWGRTSRPATPSAVRQGFELVAATPEQLARESDVICACTTCATPLFPGEWLRPGTHLNLIGAFQPHTREVDTATVARARVIVDTYAGALAEAGDLLIPIAEGAITRDHVAGDLHEVVSGKQRARRSPDEITLFKSVGCALEDLAAARVVISG